MKIDPRTTSRPCPSERHFFSNSALTALKPLAIAVVMSLQTTVLLEQSHAQQPATSLPQAFRHHRSPQALQRPPFRRAPQRPSNLQALHRPRRHLEGQILVPLIRKSPRHR
jgi:hypothetical protein